MIKPLSLCCLVALFTLFTRSGATGAPMIYEEDPFESIMHVTMPRIIEVAQTPESPTASDKTRVIATIRMGDRNQEGARIVSAQLGYTTDLVNWTYLNMAGSGKEFSAEIPPQPAGATVTYIVSAKDSFRNFATEAPYLTSWPATKDSLVRAAWDANDDGESLPDDMDIVETYVGYDDEFIYVGFTVDGNISPGTTKPPAVNIYGVKITNPDKDEGEGFLVGKLFLYAPMGPKFVWKVETKYKDKELRFPESGLGLLESETMMWDTQDASKGFIKNVELEQSIDGKLFVGKLPRAALKGNRSGYLRFVFLTFYNASMDSFMPVPMDASPYTQLNLRNHTYTVK